MLISVRVRPGAKRNAVTGVADGVWQLKIAAPPVQGKANDALVSFLSDVLSVPQSSISVLRGHTSRSKVISIEGLNKEEVTRRLSSSSASGK